MAMVRVFAGANAAGNPCEIVAGPVPDKEMVNPPGITRCFSWCLEPTTGQASDPGPRFGVACFTPGGAAIQCCGHGLLAAGWYWLRQGMSEPLHLAMGRSIVPCRTGSGMLWLSFARLRGHSVRVPGWSEAVFGSRPRRAATVGSDQGYLVLEWPRSFPLETLPIPSPELSRYTSRAVIVCSRSDGRPGAIRFRYFAPQYGVAEDAATGSAMRVLMDYWQQRYQVVSIEAFQCSPAGGIMSARVDADRIAVGGRVECSEVNLNDRQPCP